MGPEEVMELVHEGEKYGCKEALFTLGENLNCVIQRQEKI
ncbi:MAG: hypothetical protein CM1200mP30_21000 [Pseudomonadota bacterium]|nr:MAG: hypothetical protein CM1200mP30_21000 [Pseudomonadota bacterium]